MKETGLLTKSMGVIYIGQLFESIFYLLYLLLNSAEHSKFFQNHLPVYFWTTGSIDHQELVLLHQDTMTSHICYSINWPTNKHICEEYGII